MNLINKWRQEFILKTKSKQMEEKSSNPYFVAILVVIKANPSVSSKITRKFKEEQRIYSLFTEHLLNTKETRALLDIQITLLLLSEENKIITNKQYHKCTR